MRKRAKISFEGERKLSANPRTSLETREGFRDRLIAHLAEQGISGDKDSLIKHLYEKLRGEFTESAIGRWFRAEVFPEERTLKRLASVLGLNWVYLGYGIRSITLDDPSLTQRDPELAELLNIWNSASDGFKRQLLEQARAVKQDPDSFELLAIWALVTDGKYRTQLLDHARTVLDAANKGVSVAPVARTTDPYQEQIIRALDGLKDDVDAKRHVLWIIKNVQITKPPQS